MALAQQPAVVVVLDGANVARQKDGVTSIPKLAAAIEYFRSSACASSKFPVKCVAFVPNFWLNAKPAAGAGPQENGVMRTDEWELLRQLVDKDHVTLTPSQAHDDFYVIDYAVKYDGFIVTNDMFRDHIANKRVFHGKRLTRAWVKAHCIDFTFVGAEFMPNPTAMARVFEFDPAAAPVVPASHPASTSRVPLNGGIARSLSMEEKTAVTDADQEDEEDDEEDDMDIDNLKRKKNIDLSEVTHYRLPRDLLPMLHGEGGDTMKQFQEFTDTYIVLPSLPSAAGAGSSGVVTLSIYGPEQNRQRAVALLDPLLANYQNAQAQVHHYQTQQQHHYHQQFQHQQPQQFTHRPSAYPHPHEGYVHALHPKYTATGGGAQDDQMMDIDPY